MSDEWFDVVDAQDRVIGRERRREVHRRGLRHRAVHVLVSDDAGRVFLQQRSRTKDTAPGLWDSSASGHLDAGEDYDACAVREVGEELGWTPPTPPVRLARIEARAETGQEFVWVYHARWDGRPFTLNRDEIDGGEWLAPEAIDAAVRGRPAEFATSFRFIWATVRAALASAHRG